jgi:hypothetical protein
MNNQRFTLTSEHLKLLQRAIVTWEDCEFGAPAIDCKRPYGNSSVYHDIAEILGIPANQDEDEPYTREQYERMRQLHGETQTALQIILATLKFGVGEYEADKYDTNWRQL